jgi:cytochrome c5
MTTTYILVAACTVLFACNRSRRMWDGVYTPEQSARGAAVYDTFCMNCHSVGDAVLNRRLSGKTFMDNWREDTLKSLYEKIRTTMPSEEPATLSDQQYVDVVAFILKQNGFPEGRKELTPETLADVLVTGKRGPEPLPNGALVQTSGCLSKAPDGSWRLNKAAPFIRRRTFNEIAPDEIRRYKQASLGRENIALTTRMFDAFSGNSNVLLSLANRRVAVVGRIVQNGAYIQLAILNVKDVDEHCGP